MSILEMIDNAVSDWETSPDAMRWSPEPPPPAGAVRVEWTPEQIDALRAQVERAFRPMRLFFEQFAVTLTQIAEELKPLFAAPAGERLYTRLHHCRPVNPSPRYARMHSAYRRRRR